ncbi:MAG: acyl carrier protein [Planctomycetota bacterium]
MECKIEKQIVDFVQTVTTDTQISAATDLVEENYLDSLLLMDLVILIENEMGVALSGDEVAPEHFRTIHRLANLVRNKIALNIQERRIAA